ncbi:helix-turn-helix domain-containing protein [Parasphingorhabdus sp.]|uniref:helix-turn-helix domain-containing protein n=1 Tax=Parasphingorhabdus sp. TaxID=2709688 RepID=UPI003A8CAD38
MADLMTINDFMKRYSISRSQTYRLAASKQLTIVKMGTASRIRREDAEAWAASLPEYKGEAA